MHGSQGIYMMNPARAKSAENPTDTDDPTDTSDTIDWLVKNIPQSNGRVGISGISYDGFLPLMALINPHPALKVSVPMNPMVDGWRGDDWFHNGAFRQGMMPYTWKQEATKQGNAPWITDVADDYEYYLKGGSAGAIGRRQGLEQLGFWRKIIAHPAYDAFWSHQAMDTVLAGLPLTVPTMVVGGFWDQEDIYGAPAVYRALEAKDTANDMVFLLIGPWYHGQENQDGSALGAIKWDADTAKWWRWNVLAPFLAHYLKSDNPPMHVAPVTIFQSGTNVWQQRDNWLTKPTKSVSVYLKPGRALGFYPSTSPASTVSYVSDPAAPVGYRVRPTRTYNAEGSTWRQWLVDDQRGLTFSTDALTASMAISGTPMVNLTAATSGTDSDWIVKLIDVYPDVNPSDKSIAGYQLAVAMDIFRGRYREDASKGQPISANTPQVYRFSLPVANHVFLPSHRLMVQIQSTWFPLYAAIPRNMSPIYLKQRQDYIRAEQRITVSGKFGSFLTLPLQVR